MPVATELVPMATPAAAAQAGADAESLVPVPGAEAQAGVTATTVTFDVYMPQFDRAAFSPLTVDVPEDLETAGLLK